jgi:hypothetical protein
MRKVDWNSVPDQQDFKKLTPGGYICNITSAIDVPDKEYIKIEFDIAEGEFAGHYARLFEAKGWWGGRFVKSYKEKAQPMFKGFLTAVKNSNPGFQFNNDESKLIGKVVGLVLAEEEYTKKDGAIGVRLYVDRPRSVEQIRKGEFEAPALKRIKTNPMPFGGVVIDDQDIPF